MKRLSVEEKKIVVQRYCKRQKCESCCLLMTEFCQLGNESPRAINEAFDTLMKNRSLNVKVTKRGKNK